MTSNVNFSFLCCLIGFLVVDCQPADHREKLIILDTDIATDYDDAGALAMLHTFMNKEECNILATMSSTDHESVPKVLAIINSYFGRPFIPVGKAHQTAPKMVAANGWVDSVGSRFGNLLQPTTPFEDAVPLYRKIMAQSPDASITIVSIGFLANLAALLESKGDSYSDLDGIQLVKKKVAKLVLMGGAFPEGKEYNFSEDAYAAEHVFLHWPTTIICSGYEIGSLIFTGSTFKAMPDYQNPVNWVYRYNFATRGEEARQSWDQTTILMAVGDEDHYFYLHGPGQVKVLSDGSNSWNPGVEREHYFVSHKYPYSVIEREIEKLMTDTIKRKQ